jgi:hypothetical protein
LLTKVDVKEYLAQASVPAGSGSDIKPIKKICPSIRLKKFFAAGGCQLIETGYSLHKLGIYTTLDKNKDGFVDVDIYEEILKASDGMDPFIHPLIRNHQGMAKSKGKKIICSTSIDPKLIYVNTQNS